MRARGRGAGARRPRVGGGLRGRAAAAPADPASRDAAREQAIRMLARRDYAKRELAGRLTERGFAAGAARGAVDALEDERLVSDQRYVESAIASRVARGQGPRRIALELMRLGVDAELVARSVDASSPDWTRRALELKERRFGRAAPADSRERTRQVRFLLYRGYTPEHVRAALGRHAGDFDDLDLDDPEARSDE